MTRRPDTPKMNLSEYRLRNEPRKLLKRKPGILCSEESKPHNDFAKRIIYDAPARHPENEHERIQVTKRTQEVIQNKGMGILCSEEPNKSFFNRHPDLQER